MRIQQLGRAGPQVSDLGLGSMGMSDWYGPAGEAESIATIHAAIDAGINLLDTGDFYGMGHNEMLLGRAPEGRRDRVLLSVKFGAMRAPSGAFIGVDGRPHAVQNFAAYSLRRLKTDHIDTYRLTRLDPGVPIEDTVGAIADLIQGGYVRFVGLSEVSAATVRRAHAVHPICDLQIEYSLVSRGIEKAILPAVRELGIAVTAYGVLSRGLLTGSQPGERNDIRARLPRFTGDELRTEPAIDRRAGSSGGGEKCDAGPARNRLGSEQGPRHRSRDWRAHAGTTGGLDGGARPDAVGRRHCPRGGNLQCRARRGNQV
jgi:aryl-alcohol dehydrogenase-like predicted oxidoreductase